MHLYITICRHEHSSMIVMPMEIFVSCVGDLATLGRVRVALDLGLSPPWSFFFRDALGSGKFSLWRFPCVLAGLSL